MIKKIGFKPQDKETNEQKIFLSIAVLMNVALGKSTQMSTVYLEGGGEYGVDGNTNQRWTGLSCFHTADEGETNPWWRVDLGNNYHVYRVVLYNRIDCCGR